MSDDLFVEINESYNENNNSFELRYNRERRLENAPEGVKLLHSPDYIKRQSFFASIWSNKGHRFIFIAIIILASLNLSLFFYYYSSSSGKIDGIKVEMETFQYDEDVLINVIFSEGKPEEKDLKVYAKSFNAKGEEIGLAQTQGIYIGAKLILHLKLENKDVEKVETIILANKKVLTLSKKI